MQVNVVHILVCCLGLQLASYGQTSHEVVIKNRLGQPLSDVHVFDINYDISTFSNDFGYVYLTGLTNLDTIVFSSIGYKTIVLGWDDLLKKGSEIHLERLSANLSEVVVFGRTEETTTNNHAQVAQIDAREIQFEQSQTAADLLEKSGEVFVQKSQFGGGSPIIRGFEANRVLLVVDGVRMNNLIYRSGHLQNSITIDPSILDGADVIFGPNSLAYGSDALGGVVHFKTRDPMLKFDRQNAWDIKASARTASANFEKRAHVDISYGSRKWASLSSITFVDYDDLRAGEKFDDTYPDFGKRLYYVEPDNAKDRVVRNDEVANQVGTGFSQWDFLQKIKYQPSNKYSHILNFQFSMSSDIPRYDQLSEVGESPRDFSWAEWNYGPQNRLLISSKSDWTPEKNTLFDRALLILAFQDLDEERITRRFDSRNRFYQEEDVQVYSATLDLKKSVLSGDLAYGFEGNFNQLGSTGSVERLPGGMVFPAQSRYPNGGNEQWSFGMYAKYTAEIVRGLRANLGIRYSSVQNNIKYSRTGFLQWPERFYNGISNTNDAITWMGSLSYQNNGWTIQGQSGTAFRAPNIDDLAKIRVKGDYSNVPNLNLQPEKSWNVDLLIRKSLHQAGAWIQATGFYTILDDAIVQSIFSLPNGDSVLWFDNEPFRLIANVNAQEGYIYGVSFATQVPIYANLDLSANVNYTYGRSTLEGRDRPLAHIPPLYGKVKMDYVKEKWSVAGVVRFNGKKKAEDFALDSSDNLEFATPEGSLSWVTYNVYTELEIAADITLQMAIENITDLHYRTFSSGISAPGRNFILAILAEI